jgi:protein farnesyltransferase subunit beta
MVILSLLNLPLELPKSSPGRVNGDEMFSTGLAEYVARCEYWLLCCAARGGRAPLTAATPGQTYEGGIGCAPGAEAHGAYAFCGLACLCIMGEPHEILPKYVTLFTPAMVTQLLKPRKVPRHASTHFMALSKTTCTRRWTSRTHE